MLALVNRASLQDLKALLDVYNWPQLQTYSKKSQKYIEKADSILMTKSQMITNCKHKKSIADKEIVKIFLIKMLK